MTDNTSPDAALHALKMAVFDAKHAYGKASRAETEARNKAFDAQDRLEEAAIALAEAELKGQGILLGKCLVNLYFEMRPKGSKCGPGSSAGNTRPTSQSCTSPR